MKQTWIALTLAGALCASLAGCAGDKTGSNMDPSASPSPTAQTTPTATPNGAGAGADDQQQENNTDAANGGNNVSGAPVGDPDGTGADVGDTGGAGAAGQADDSALERMGEGIKDTLDDLGADARRMAQNAKRAME